jgi:hypothetical protein
VGGRELCGWQKTVWVGSARPRGGRGRATPRGREICHCGPTRAHRDRADPLDFEFFLADAPEAAPSPEDSLDLREVYVTLARLTYS